MTPHQRAKVLHEIANDILNEGGAKELGDLALRLVRGNVPEDREMMTTAIILGDVTSTALAVAVWGMPGKSRAEAVSLFVDGLRRHTESALKAIDKMEAEK